MVGDYMFILCILFIIITIILCVVIFKYKRPRIDTLNGISGQVGGGKTSSCICRVISYLKRVYFLGRRKKKYPNDYIILANFPLGKEEKKKGKLTGKRYIRIWLKKIYCYDLTLDIILLQKRLPQNEVIIIIDEFSSIVSQLDFSLPIVKDNIKEFARCYRQYTESKGLLFWVDQCAKEIVNPVRRRTAYCYNMLHSNKLLLLPIVIYEYRKILISDEVENTTDTTTNTNESDIKKFIFFCNPFKWYDSNYLSERYKAIKDIAELRSSISLKRNDLLKLPVIEYLYYETLIYDNITKEDYVNSQKKKK